jgi:hypothetical protein
MRLLAFAFLLLVGVALTASDDDAGRKPTVVFFLNAEKYHQLPLAMRTAYLEGWLDGRLNAGLIGDTAETITAQRTCVIGKTETQITAIVDQYIETHPETWYLPAAMEADNALQSVCPALKRAIDNMLQKRR